MSNEPIRAWVRQLYKTMPAKIWGIAHINMQRVIVKDHQHAPKFEDTKVV